MKKIISKIRRDKARRKKVDQALIPKPSMGINHQEYTIQKNKNQINTFQQFQTGKIRKSTIMLIEK